METNASAFRSVWFASFRSPSACLAVMFTACCLAQAPLPIEKASVSGIVTSATGEPLRRATVRLTPLSSGRGSSGDASASSSSTDTDSQGNFTFDELTPGRYSLVAERSGYLNQPYLGTRGTALTISAGQRVTGVVIKMLPQGIVAGKVVDDENEPLSGVTVKVSFYDVPKELRRRQIEPRATGTTDADGAFAIGDLKPGRYLVSVAAKASDPSSVKSTPLRNQAAYVTTYYPDATDAAEAAPVELDPGAQVRGLEIRLKKLPTFRISGKVINAATGQAVSPDSLILIRQGSATPGLSARSTGVTTAGEFSFNSVLPGAYILETKPVDETDDHPPLVGWQSISVGDEDLERVVVEMKAPIELRGKIIAEGTPPSSWPQITLSPMEGLNYLDSAVIDEAGHFAIAGLEPAPYNLTVGIVPSPMFVKSIRVNGHDLAGGDLDFASAPAASVEIVMSSGTSSISGVVSDSGEPVGAAVTVMATNMSRQPTYRITRTDENGRFSFGGLPPGDYFLAATDIGDEPLIFPDVLVKLAKTVSVDDGAAAAIDLRLITTDDLRAANSSQ